MLRKTLCEHVSGLCTAGWLFGCFQKLVQLILSLTIHRMYIGKNVLKRCRGAIGKVNEQRQERIHLFITSVTVLHKLELVVLSGLNAIR